MIKLQTCFHIGRINSAIMNIGIPIYETTIRGIDISLCGVVRPTIVPSNPRSIERRTLITWGLCVSIWICLSKIRICRISARTPTFCRFRYKTNTVCILNTSTLTHYIRLLSIRAYNVDIHIANKGVFHVYFHIINVIGIPNIGI